MRHHRSTNVPIARMPVPRLLGVLAASTALVAVSAGCTGGTDGAGATTGAVAAPTGNSAAAPVPAAAAPLPGASPSALGSTSPPAPAALPAIGTRRGSAIDNATVDVTLNSVVADGAVMTVTWTVRNAGQQPWRIGDYFYAGYYFDSTVKATGVAIDYVEGLARSDGQADGVYVLDRVNARRYLTGRDKDARCACSSGLGLANLEPGGEAVLEAQYKAPPADVTTVDVVIPRVGSFRDVPVTR
ncbi:hypothetical protein [Nostocoides vanveenii]|uniref:DUF4352 domain-containing protein n=1 Tax=Nostocoides vanveenii TaxID=330835 RepID=A0ABN2KXQ4_9MICO